MPFDSKGDTRRLLRECDAGIRMGIASLDDILPQVNAPALEQVFLEQKMEHKALRARAEALLNYIKDEGKPPNPIAKAMGHMKTKLYTAYEGTDAAAARLISKGCDMGISSLERYLGKYPAADSRSVGLARDIIAAEKRLMTDLKNYL